MTPIIGYCRVSGLGQCKEDKDGFERQGVAMEKFCAANGYDLQAVFMERGVSGTTDETARPAFSEMVTMMLGNCCRHIVVENLSRLAREYRIQEQLLFYLATKKIDLISADTGENITQSMLADPMKKAVIQIQGIFFELERSMLVHKLRVARQRMKAKTGRCEGRKPFGQNEREMTVLNRAQELRREGCTIKEIVLALNCEGLKPKNESARWHPTSLGRILRRG